MTIQQASTVQMDPGQRVIPSAAVSGLEMPNITVLLPKSQLAGTHHSRRPHNASALQTQPG